ncbi:MAG: hypothetical protein LBH00_06675 [Planctomycetaceae bacterium]|jgi:hypothetical protein|nr:hypothetical protein [Planctomycetaceae bacterium]
MFRTIFSLLFAAAMPAVFAASCFSATPVPELKFKPQAPKAEAVRGINDRLPETFYPTYIRSPKSITKSGEWKAFVARVQFTTTKDNATIRVHGSVTRLQTDVAIRQTSSIAVFKPGVNAINQDAQGNVTFGTAEGGLARGDANKTWDIIIPTATTSWIDIMFLDCDQNIPNNEPATQVAAAVEYVYTGDAPGTDFTFDYAHGWDTEQKSSSPADKHWSVLKLQEMSFSGGWDVLKDADGTSYTAPHWVRVIGGTDYPAPYLYTSHSAASNANKLTVSAKWTIVDAGDDPITASTPVQISAVCKDTDGGNINFVPVTTTITGNMSAPIAAAAPFSVKTRYFNPLDLTLQLRFTTGNADPKFDDAGATMNPLYVCLGKAADVDAVARFRTVAHVACAEDGQTNSEAAFGKTWDIFKTLDVRGWNNSEKKYSRPLYYYKPGTTFAENSGVFEQFLEEGTGQCGAWRMFLWYASLLNGKELEGEMATSVKNISSLGYFDAKEVIVVRDWNPQSGELIFNSGTTTWNMWPVPPGNQYGSMTNLNTLKGQNSGNSAPQEKVFTLHYILKSTDGGTSGTFYDPSYGATYTGPQDFQTKALNECFGTLPSVVNGQFQSTVTRYNAMTLRTVFIPQNLRDPYFTKFVLEANAVRETKTLEEYETKRLLNDLNKRGLKVARSAERFGEDGQYVGGLFADPLALAQGHGWQRAARNQQRRDIQSSFLTAWSKYVSNMDSYIQVITTNNGHTPITAAQIKTVKEMRKELKDMNILTLEQFVEKVYPLDKAGTIELSPSRIRAYHAYLKNALKDALVEKPLSKLEEADPMFRAFKETNK